MGCKSSRRVNVKDDGEYSIPNPFSTDEQNDMPKSFHELGDINDPLPETEAPSGAGSGAGAGAGAGSGTPVGSSKLKKKVRLPPPKLGARGGRKRGGFSQSMRTLNIDPEADAKPKAVLSKTPKLHKRPVMLAAIGRAKSERVLSLRQKRALSIRSGLLKNARGVALGRIEDDGTWVGQNNSRRGVFKPDGTIRSSDGTLMGSIEPDTGSVLGRDKRPIGTIRRDGSVRSNLGGSVGHVTADGVAFNTRGQKLGSCDAGDDKKASTPKGRSERRRSRKGSRSSRGSRGSRASRKS